jgi:NADP-dependent 3-hydroxy acid dehydrogenase YdfG
MAENLTGSVAYVTGGSSGLGAETARTLAGLGVAVAVSARRKDKLDDLVTEIENAGGRALAIEADITDRAQAEVAVSTVVETFGRLDILINNAGLMLLGHVTGADPHEWEQMVQINILAALYTTHAAIPHLLDAATSSPRKVADLINISSSAGHQAYPINGVYALTKFGTNGLTESLRQELNPQGVRVHQIAPGAVKTELFGHNKQEVLDAIADDSFEPIEPSDIAETVEFILTRPARASVNTIWVGPTGQL